MPHTVHQALYVSHHMIGGVRGFRTAFIQVGATSLFLARLMSVARWDWVEHPRLSIVVRWCSPTSPCSSSPSNSFHARRVSPSFSSCTSLAVRILLSSSPDLASTFAVRSLGSMPRCAISCCSASTSSVRPSTCKALRSMLRVNCHDLPHKGGTE